MNSDHIKGKANEIAGEIQEHAGRWVGNKQQELKGHEKEMSGKAQQAQADLKDTINDTTENYRAGNR